MDERPRKRQRRAVGRYADMRLVCACEGETFQVVPGMRLSPWKGCVEFSRGEPLRLAFLEHAVVSKDMVILMEEDRVTLVCSSGKRRTFEAKGVLSVAADGDGNCWWLMDRCLNSWKGGVRRKVRLEKAPVSVTFTKRGLVLQHLALGGDLLELWDKEELTLVDHMKLTDHYRLIGSIDQEWPLLQNPLGTFYVDVSGKKFYMLYTTPWSCASCKPPNLPSSI